MYSTRKKMPDFLRKIINVLFILFLGSIGYFVYLMLWEGDIVITLPSIPHFWSSNSASHRPTITQKSSARTADTASKKSTFSIEYRGDERLFTVFCALNVLGYERGLHAGNSSRIAIREYLYQRVRDGLLPVYDDIDRYFRAKSMSPSSLSSSQINMLIRFAFSLPRKPPYILDGATNAPSHLKGFDTLINTFYRQGNIGFLWKKYRRVERSRAASYRTLIPKYVADWVKCLNSPLRIKGVTLCTNILGSDHDVRYIPAKQGQSAVIVLGPSVARFSVETRDRLRTLLFTHLFVQHTAAALHKQKRSLTRLYTLVKNKEAMRRNMITWQTLPLRSFLKALTVHCQANETEMIEMKNEMKRGYLYTSFYLEGIQRYYEQSQDFWTYISQWTSTIASRESEIKADYLRTRR